MEKYLVHDDMVFPLCNAADILDFMFKIRSFPDLSSFETFANAIKCVLSAGASICSRTKLQYYLWVLSLIYSVSHVCLPLNSTRTSALFLVDALLMMKCSQLSWYVWRNHLITDDCRAGSVEKADCRLVLHCEWEVTGGCKRLLVILMTHTQWYGYCVVCVSCG